eukprot:8986748-Pyramimonas_sp.AAC.1
MGKLQGEILAFQASACSGPGVRRQLGCSVSRASSAVAFCLNFHLEAARELLDGRQDGVGL